jgi:hypothetical protein
MKTKRKLVINPKLDAEERAILRSYEKGEWVLAPNQEEEKKRLQAAARETMKMLKKKYLDKKV